MLTHSDCKTILTALRADWEQRQHMMSVQEMAEHMETVNRVDLLKERIEKRGTLA